MHIIIFTHVNHIFECTNSFIQLNHTDEKFFDHSPSASNLHFKRPREKFLGEVLQKPLLEGVFLVVKEEFCDIQGGVSSGLAMNEGKSKKSVFRGRKPHLSMYQEKSQLRCHLENNCHLKGFLEKS
jgi:hypothetical protein